MQAAPMKAKQSGPKLTRKTQMSFSCAPFLLVLLFPAHETHKVMV